jgi:hypothetical protein
MDCAKCGVNRDVKGGYCDECFPGIRDQVTDLITDFLEAMETLPDESPYGQAIFDEFVVTLAEVYAKPTRWPMQNRFVSLN